MPTLATHPSFTALLVSACVSLAACSPAQNDKALNDDLASSKSEPVQGPLDGVQQNLIGEVLENRIASNLPDLPAANVQCASDALNALVDAPDAIFASLARQPGSDSAIAMQSASNPLIGTMERFTVNLQNLLVALANQTECGSVSSTSGMDSLQNTPFSAADSALQDMASSLTGFRASAGANGTTDDGDPNLTALTSLLRPQLLLVSTALNMLPDMYKEAPVVGGLLLTLRDATFDLSQMMDPVGDYDPLGTNEATALLLYNLLSNIFLEVLPADQFDAQSGGNYSETMQGLIQTLVGTVGQVTLIVLAPTFETGLNGAASPILDPVEQLITDVLASAGLAGDPNSGNPLTAFLHRLFGGV